VDKPETSLPFEKGSREQGIIMWEDEKKQMDEIMKTYPRMLPEKIRQYWLARVKHLPMHNTDELELIIRRMLVEEKGSYDRWYYPLRLEFRNLLKEEYECRLSEYSDLMGRKNQPKAPN